MSKDLTNSNVERQNILNNRYAIQKVQEFVGLPGMLFEEEFRFTRKMVAEYFEIDQRTLSRYLATNEKELCPAQMILHGSLIRTSIMDDVVKLDPYKIFNNVSKISKNCTRIINPLEYTA